MDEPLTDHSGVPGHQHSDVFAETARLHQDAHQIVGVLAEERVWVDDVVKLAPIAPLPSKRSERKGLSGADLTGPEDALPAVCGSEPLHDCLQAGARDRKSVVEGKRAGAGGGGVMGENKVRGGEKWWRLGVG